MITKIPRIPRLLSAVTVLAALSWQAAPAAELGFYVGGSYGNGSKSIDKALFGNYATQVFNDIGFLPAQFSSTIDTSNPGYGFVAGYRLFPHLAVEGGYMEIGKVRYEARTAGSYLQSDGTQIPDTPTMSINAKTGGFALSALGILPLSYRWELYGRAGLMFSSNERTLFLAGNVLSGKEQVTGSSTDFLVGAGASFTFAEIYGLRAEYQRVFDAGDSDTVGEGDVDLVTVGVTVQF